MILLDGKKVAKEIQNNLTQKVNELYEKFNKKPKLVGVVVGNNPSSLVYVKNKVNACKKVGILVEIINLDENCTQEMLNQTLTNLSNDKEVNGILLQLPLPNHLNPRIAISHIDCSKDVDGLTCENLGKLLAHEESALPACTAKGIITLLKYYNINLEGKHCVIVGRSLLVGKPLMALMLQNNAYVTICHSKTPKLKKYTKQADILVCATGNKGLIQANYVKKNAVVVDVSIVKVDDKLYGDVNFETVSKKASYLSPVPGGVGPLTVASLLENTVLAFERQMNLK